MKNLLLLLALLLMAGCMGYPEKVQPVTSFNVQNYMGTWYEIARLDHKFERGMNQVTAEYSLKDNGTVKVINKGFLTPENKWKTAEGKAKFATTPDIGYLKVSFFGPFYGSYVIFDLDDSSYSFLCGPDTSYLWFLSRTPTVSDELKQKFIKEAQERGFDSSKLIWVDQTAITQ